MRGLDALECDRTRLAGYYASPKPSIKAAFVGMDPLPPLPCKNGDTSEGIWWEAGLSTIQGFDVVTKAQNVSPISEAAKGARLALKLNRRGRQVEAGLSVTLAGYDDQVGYPVTLFTGSWIAHLLGYSRKYRGAKIVETFAGSAVRAYLLTYLSVPTCLSVCGAFFNFNFFWRVINSPSNQVFIHPITMGVVWDVRLPLSLGSSFEEVRAALTNAAADLGRGGIPWDDEILDYEARNLSFDTANVRYRFSWAQVLFLPTRLSKRRKSKKARSIKKRLSKRLVRATGRRFWAG